MAERSSENKTHLSWQKPGAKWLDRRHFHHLGIQDDPVALPVAQGRDSRLGLMVATIA